MRSLYLIAIIPILLASCSKNQETISSKITPKIDSLFARAKDFSGVVLVADKGKPVYHKAFGYRNFDTKEPMDTTAIFELASVSKQFTAMVIMMLNEEGKLRYDDPLDKYIPGLPYKNITIRHLLTHTSGLPDYQLVMDEHWDKTKVAGNTECIGYLTRYAPTKRFEPGEKYEYSNTGYMLLASVAEKASGIDFISFVRTRIFVPLEMTSTDIRTQDEKKLLRNIAWGYLWVAEKNAYVRADSLIQSAYNIWLGNRKGPGRISSCSSDLLKWDQTLYKGTLVGDSTLNEAFSPMRLFSGESSNYGFGWSLENDPKLGRVVRHSGDNPGYRTHIIRYIDANRTVIILCNNACPEFNDLLKGVQAIANLY
jgi:CubicO group peptidase (beta-lactamase class C family)